MIMNKLLLGLTLSWFSLYAFGQNDSLKSKFNLSPTLKVSFNSSLIYPGLSLGIEFPVIAGKVNKIEKRSIEKVFVKDKAISGNISWYHHPGFHDNLYLTVEWIMRRTRSGGFFSEFAPGIGVSRTFLAGTTYRVSDNGTISVKKLAGYNYAVINVGGGAGYNFQDRKNLPLSVFARMNLLTMFPYNNVIYVRPVLEIGIRFIPGRLAFCRSKMK
jgi:hypothetical protein